MKKLGFSVAETAKGQGFVASFDGYLCFLLPEPRSTDWRWSVESGGGLTLRGDAEEIVVHAEGVSSSLVSAEGEIQHWLQENAEYPNDVTLHNPSPDEVRAVRKRLKLTQLDAAQVTSVAEGKSYRSWQNFETEKGKPNHRQIPNATWELFLLFTNQHPYYCLASRVSADQKTPE